MKKIAALAPIAILLGLPASSIAMEVELYGLIDTGFKYQNRKKCIVFCHGEW